MSTQGLKAAFWHKALPLVWQAFFPEMQKGGLEQAVYCYIVLKGKPKCRCSWLERIKPGPGLYIYMAMG
jgi:hypothetical protein